MVATVAVLGLLYLCVLIHMSRQLIAERAENGRLRRENVRLITLLGAQRAGIDITERPRIPIGPGHPARNPFPLEVP